MANGRLTTHSLLRRSGSLLTNLRYKLYSTALFPSNLIWLYLYVHSLVAGPLFSNVHCKRQQMEAALYFWGSRIETLHSPACRQRRLTEASRNCFLGHWVSDESLWPKTTQDSIINNAQQITSYIYIIVSGQRRSGDWENCTDHMDAINRPRCEFKLS